MAVDEAILESVAGNTQPPTLRLYDWHPYTLSLGQGQPISDVDLAALGLKGWDIVRRPTGGRAILHADELTYSVCAPEDNPRVSGSVVESYRKLSSGLLRGLALAGITADSKPKAEFKKTAAMNPVCFEHPSDYEITYQGRKLIGSAQVRRGGSLLQHGALPLNGAITRVVEVLAFSDETERNKAQEKLLKRAITVADILNRPVSWQVMANHIVLGFSQALEISLQPGTLSPVEKARAHDLWKNRYAADQWTKRI